MKNKTKIILVLSMILIMLTIPMSFAQTGSLAVWENIADGTLICDWLETADDVWTAVNDSGLWEYNCTGKAYNVSVNNSIIGSRWFQTFEVHVDDPTTGIAAIQTIDITAPTTKFYAVEYYISNSDLGQPGAFIVYHEDGTNYYWSSESKQWDANISNATEYSGQQEIDFYTGSDFAKVKALWNWNDYDTGDDLNCTVRFKVWLESDDEPTLWMIDDAFTMYGSTTAQSYYPGIGANHTSAGAGITSFRRLFFWNLSFDYDEECHTASDKIPYIGVPQYDAETLINLMAANTGEDMWNLTQAFKTMINLWDLTSFYNESYAAGTGAQNDTIYIFSILTTGWEDFFEEYFEFEYPGEVFPNNILIFYMYETIDGTPTDGSITWSDHALIRFDFNNDGYTADDYSFALVGHSGGTLFGYHGWTQVIPDSPSEWYGAGGIYAQDDDSDWGKVFRDYNYPAYVMFLNWDLISHNKDAGECVNISICFYDNETDNFAIWQDWNLTNDTTPYTTPSDNASWKEAAWNDTSLWGIMVIEGGHLDFDDPIVLPPLTRTVVNIYPILIAAFILFAVFLLAISSMLTVKSAIAILILSILAIVTIQIITSI